MTTLASNFPVKEVATAAAVSTSTTAMVIIPTFFCFHFSLLFHQVVAILCCCCFPCRKKRGRARNLDVNENEKVKEGEEGKGDRLFHQRYEGDGCGRWLFLFQSAHFTIASVSAGCGWVACTRPVANARLLPTAGTRRPRQGKRASTARSGLQRFLTLVIMAILT